MIPHGMAGGLFSLVRICGELKFPRLGPLKCHLNAVWTHKHTLPVSQSVCSVMVRARSGNRAVQTQPFLFLFCSYFPPPSNAKSCENPCSFPSWLRALICLPVPVPDSVYKTRVEYCATGSVLEKQCYDFTTDSGTENCHQLMQIIYTIISIK